MLDKIHNPIVSVIGGFLLTLVFLFAVPIACNNYLQPILSDVFGTILSSIISSFLIALLMWGALLLFSLLLGGMSIVKRFGPLGLIGLVAAYYFFDDLYNAILPLASVVILMLIIYIRGDEL